MRKEATLHGVGAVCLGTEQLGWARGCCTEPLWQLGTACATDSYNTLMYSYKRRRDVFLINTRRQYFIMPASETIFLSGNHTYQTTEL